MGSGLVASTPNMFVALIVLAAFYLGAKGARALIYRIARRHAKHRNAGLVLGRLTQGAIVVLGLLVACVIVLPNFTPASLVSFLGIGSVAVGFAFRDVLQNYLAGILLLVTEPFRIGDQIVFEEFEGTVEDIQTRATFIRTYDGRRIVIPNAELFTNAVVVNTALGSRRIEYDVTIGYGDDVDRAKSVVLDAVRSLDVVLKDPPPDVLTMELGESGVSLRVRWWIRPPEKADALDARDHVLAAIKSQLQANGIDLPFPTRQILFHDQTEADDGVRGRQREGWPPGEAGPPPRSCKIADAIGDLEATVSGDAGSSCVPDLPLRSPRARSSLTAD
jgi:small conductance mechanosensitive channel